MKTIMILISLLGLLSQGYANTGRHSTHEMQHGFILAIDDKFASHLVATKHHSWQTEVTGHLSIKDEAETKIYKERKDLNTLGSSYFLFQAQALDLPSLKEGQVLKGHIVESKIGNYEPKNVIVKDATFKIEKILLNIANPFFAE